MQIQVQAVPTDTACSHYLIQCSACGPLTVTGRTEAHDACLTHMTEHGIAIPQENP